MDPAPAAEALRVHVVVCDGVERAWIAWVLRDAGYETALYPSPRAFLADGRRGGPGCVVLDLFRRDCSNLALQAAIAASSAPLPVVFLSDRPDVATSVRAMKAGAIDVLLKPPSGNALMAAVRSALQLERLSREAREKRDLVCRQLAALTPREREVLEQLVLGRPNKRIAAALGASEKTIKIHRARVLHKMGAASIAELVRMTVDLPADSGPGR